MAKRFVSIWFPYLKTDWFTIRLPDLKACPFVLTIPDHGRLVISAANALARRENIYPGMALADARAIHSRLEVRDDRPGLELKLLKGIAEWIIRYTPQPAMDAPDGLMLDATGCPHLWGGEKQYLDDITKRLNQFGYSARVTIADTVGAAWAVSRYGKKDFIVDPAQQLSAISSLPVAALRLQPALTQRLEKLGLRRVKDFMEMPRPALRRRFGEDILLRLDQAFGHVDEHIISVIPAEPFEERLPCLEPIVSAKGIEIALQRLLHLLCARLQMEGKGLRNAVLSCYRVDGKIIQIEIGTNRGSCNAAHLFRLFEFKISGIEPALGIELFLLNASRVEDLNPVQETLFSNTKNLQDTALAELLDRISIKNGAGCINRYLPAEHYWPERSFQKASEISDKPLCPWNIGRPRPLFLLPKPETIQVTAPIPDYPPMMFRYKAVLHKIARADGPERIEQEWWLQDGQHRDYYLVEDEEGHRYWIFRSGHYDVEKTYAWFIHGFFA